MAITWRKAPCDSGACVEVGTDKSTDGALVYIKTDHGVTFARRDEFVAFAQAIKAGRFDDLLA